MFSGSRRHSPIFVPILFVNWAEAVSESSRCSAFRDAIWVWITRKLPSDTALNLPGEIGDRRRAGADNSDDGNAGVGHACRGHLRMAGKASLEYGSRVAT